MVSWQSSFGHEDMLSTALNVRAYVAADDEIRRDVSELS